MASPSAAGNALRPLRLPRIVELLREQPLPAEVLLPRLNRRLKADGWRLVHDQGFRYWSQRRYQRA